MIKSMTGYGKIFNNYENFNIYVEIKSVNSRYFDPYFRLPKVISNMEITLRNPIQEKIIRGKTDIRIEINLNSITKIPVIDHSLLQHYKQLLEEIKINTGIQENIKLEHYLRLPDIIEFKSNDTLEEIVTKSVFNSVMECIDQLNIMREKEGAALLKELKIRVNNLKLLILDIENCRENVFNIWLNKFKKRLVELEVSGQYEERIIQEASIYAEKADINEEITRIYSHINQFNAILDSEEQVGKKLDFLSQEINREFNTIASKSNQSKIINNVVEAKAEIDRIREQVQNIV